MAKVFVSYSRKDIAFAKRLTPELQKCEMDFWIDWEGIPPTVDWWREIEKGIEEADIFLFLISPDSARSKVCGQEIETAAKNGKRIIPAVVRHVAWEETPKDLRHLNYIFFREEDDFDAAVKKLITAIQTDYEWAATHRRLQVKALDWERNNKESGFLLRGLDLLDAEQDLAMNTSKEPHPTDLQREYVFESRKFTDRQRRIITIASLATAIALAALAAFGFYQANETRKQANIVRAEGASALALVEKERQFNLALLFGVEGYRNATDSLRTQGALLALTDSHPGLEIFLSGHTDIVRSVSFSPDGDYLVSGSDDGFIILWDVRDPKNPSQVFKLPEYNSNHSDVSFHPDGKVLAWGDPDGTIKLCNIAHPKTIVKLTHDSDQAISDIASISFSPDGNYLAAASDSDYLTAHVTGTYKPVIILWDIRDPTNDSLSISSVPGVSVDFSPDGQRLATGNQDGTVTLWDIRDRANPSQIFTSTSEHRLPGGDLGGLVDSVAFSPDGNRLVSSSNNGSVVLWDLSDPSQPFRSANTIGEPGSERGYLSKVIYSPDGGHIAWVGMSDFSVFVWNTNDYVDPSEPNPLKLIGHNNFALSVSFSPDGSRLASGGMDGSIILWNVDNPTPPSRLGMYSADKSAFSPDLKHIAAVNYLDRHMTLIETANPANSSPLETYSDIAMLPTSLVFSPKGTYLASWRDNGSILLWDLNKSITRHELDLSVDSRLVSLVFSPNDRYLVSGHENGSVYCWDITNLDLPRLFSEVPGHTERIIDLVFSPDGKQISLRSSDDTVILLDISDPQHPQQIAKHSVKRHPASDPAFSGDGSRFAAGDANGKIILLDVRDPDRIYRLDTQFRTPVDRLVLSADGKFLASISVFQPILLWDTRNPVFPVAKVSGHTKHVTALAFSPDGKLLASGNLYGNIILTDISNPQAPVELASFSALDQGLVSQIAFSSDGKTLLSTHNFSMLVLWDLDPESWAAKACQRAGRNFTRAEWTQYFPNEDYPTKPKDATCPQWPLDPEVTPTPTP